MSGSPESSPVLREQPNDSGLSRRELLQGAAVSLGVLALEPRKTIESMADSSCQDDPPPTSEFQKGSRPSEPTPESVALPPPKTRLYFPSVFKEAVGQSEPVVQTVEAAKVERRSGDGGVRDGLCVSGIVLAGLSIIFGARSAGN